MSSMLDEAGFCWEVVVMEPIVGIVVNHLGPTLNDQKVRRFQGISNSVCDIVLWSRM